MDAFRSAYQRLTLPSDSQGYTQCFRDPEDAGARSFFEKYGCVVIQDALSQQQCHRTVDELWTYVEAEEFRRPGESCQVVGMVQRTDPRTWTTKHGWPEDAEGMLGTPPMWGLQCMQNRQNETMYALARSILQRPDLIVAIDRCALFRPMRSELPTQLAEVQREWATARSVHLDMNPWGYFGMTGAKQTGDSKITTRYQQEKDFMQEHNENAIGTGLLPGARTKIQGLFNLVDNREEDGGFHLVPGGHASLKEWAYATRNSQLAATAASDFNVLDWFRYGKQEQVDPTGMSDDAQRVTMRAGSVLLWDYTVPHGSAPNRSDRIRMAQFFKLSVADVWSQESSIERAKVVQAQLDGSGCTVSELGSKLLGIHSW
jgi:hypothetical protein